MEIVIRKQEEINMSTCWSDAACNGDVCNPD